jgi:hypothetical protein
LAFLASLGLTDSETRAYRALMALGPSTAMRVVSAAGITSGKVYEVLDRLSKRGLVSVTKVNNVATFAACDPAVLSNLVEEAETRASGQRQALPGVIGFLQDNAALPATPRAEVYIGLRSLSALISNAYASLSPGSEILTMGVHGNRSERFNRFWTKMDQHLKQKRIRKRVLFSECTSTYWREYSRSGLSDVRFLPGFAPSAVMTLNDMTILSVYDKDVTMFVLHSPQIAASFRAFYESLWTVSLTPVQAADYARAHPPVPRS